MVTSDWSDVTALVDEMIGHYHLNADQSEALKQCAGMFKPGSSPTPITLIHGMTIYYTIFGSKSMSYCPGSCSFYNDGNQPCDQ